MSDIASTRARDTWASVRLARHQTVIELRRHYKLWRVLGTLAPGVILVILVRAGLPDWIGGYETFQWIISAYLALALGITGMITLSATIIGDQEDGTLLRAKTLPAGFGAHLLAKVMFLAITSLVSALIIIGAAYASGGFHSFPGVGHLLLLVPFVLGAIAVGAPIGLIAGGLSKKITNVVYISVVGYVLIAVSDIFFVPGYMPDWITGIARAFPFYWMGYASRFIMLDSSSPALGLSGTEWAWGFAILAAWLVGGGYFAPRALRRLSRRQSGSRLEKSASRAR